MLVVFIICASRSYMSLRVYFKKLFSLFCLSIRVTNEKSSKRTTWYFNGK